MPIFDICPLTSDDIAHWFVFVAIKTGRYTHAKRTQDILEYRQMLCMLSTSSCQTIPDTTGIATGLSTSFTSIHCGAASSAGWPAAANIPGNVHCRGWSAPYNHFIPSMPQAFSAAPSSITPHDAIIPRHVGMSVNSEAFSPVNVQVLPTTPMQHMLATSPVAPGFLSATSYQSDGRHCRESARHVFHPIKCDDFLYRQEPCTGVVCQSPFNHDTRFGSVSQQVVGPGGAPCRSLSYDGAGSVEVCFHTAPSHPHVLTPSSEFVVEQKQPEHLMPPPSWTSFTSRDMTDEECRLLSAELLRSHSVLFVLCRYSFSPKELLRRQTMCYVSGLFSLVLQFCQLSIGIPVLRLSLCDIVVVDVTAGTLGLSSDALELGTWKAEEFIHSMVKVAMVSFHQKRRTSYT